MPPGHKPGPDGLAGLIHSIHELRPVRSWRSCDPRRQHQLAAELTGWLATAPGSEDLQVTVVIPDETRPVDPEVVVPPVLDAISEAAQRRGEEVSVTLLVATGLHRGPSQAFARKVERSIEAFSRHSLLTVEWTHHDAEHVEQLGLPLNPLVMSRRRGGLTDAVVAVGLVEPHQYAGFSGGTKGVTIGCGSTRTIAQLHSLPMLRQSGVALGETTHNPFRNRLDDVARRHSAPIFHVALVPDPVGTGIAGLFAGGNSRAWASAVRMARKLLMVPVPRRFDFALLSVPPAKSASFYQASRALTYLALHPSPCVVDGGLLVLQARCPERYGRGRGEETFRKTLARGRRALLEELAGKREPSEPLGGGAQRAYVLARAMARFRCVLVGAPELPEAQRVGLTQVDSIEEVRLAGAGLIVDDPFVTLPYHDTEGVTVDQIVELSDRATGGPA